MHILKLLRTSTISTLHGTSILTLLGRRSLLTTSCESKLLRKDVNMMHIMFKKIEKPEMPRQYSSEVTVTHSTGVFTVAIDGKGCATLGYELDKGSNCVTIQHTKVPEAMSGLGIGKKLAKEALEFVSRNEHNLKVECEFVQHYICKYEPKYKKFLI